MGGNKILRKVPSFVCIFEAWGGGGGGGGGGWGGGGGGGGGGAGWFLVWGVCGCRVLDPMWDMGSEGSHELEPGNGKCKEKQKKQKGQKNRVRVVRSPQNRKGT